jgi:proteasome regulatory subunit
MSSKNDNYSRKLEKKIKTLEEEKKLLDIERLTFKQKVEDLKNEIDRLREPPLVGAVVIKVLDNSRVVVATSTGPFFVVNLSRKIKDKKIEPGMIVALNQRTFAVLEILPISSEEIKNAKELIFLTELTLKKDN